MIYVASWDHMMMRLFESAPRADPHLKKDGMSQAESAEECATAFKRLLYSIRNCYLDDKALERALDGASALEKSVVKFLRSFFSIKNEVI